MANEFEKIGVDKVTKQKVRRIAARENRSMAGQIKHFTDQYESNHPDWTEGITRNAPKAPRGRG